MEEVVIVGGGVAGLSCLNALLDRGHSPLLLEEKTIGLPKICGEFLAPIAASQLQQWGIGPIQTIKKVCFVTEDKQLSLPFSTPAGALARSKAEFALATRATEKGGRIREHKTIENIIPPTQNSPYIIQVGAGESIESKSLIVATGKLNPYKVVKSFPYQGFKTHIPQIIQTDTLIMSSCPGAYFGVVPISQSMSNLTCLAQKKVIEQWGGCKLFIQHLIKTNPLIAEIDLDSIEILEGKAPKFKASKIPHWPNAYWIGDALASFYPAIGYGFAHSVHSALSAADFYLKADAAGYDKFIHQHIKYKLLLSKLMHQTLMSSSLSRFLMLITKTNPWLAHSLMKTAGFNELTTKDVYL